MKSCSGNIHEIFQIANAGICWMRGIKYLILEPNNQPQKYNESGSYLRYIYLSIYLCITSLAWRESWSRLNERSKNATHVEDEKRDVRQETLWRWADPDSRNLPYWALRPLKQRQC